MDLRDHFNLIFNHNYDGYIATYTGDNQLAMSNGDVVLVKNHGNRESSYRTVEKPMRKEQIAKEVERGSLIKTICTCVCVPISKLDRIYT